MIPLFSEYLRHPERIPRSKETLLKEVDRQYPAFPFVKDGNFSTVRSALEQFATDVNTLAEQAEDKNGQGKKLAKSPLIYVTGFPGNGKKTLAHGLMREFAERVTLDTQRAHQTVAMKMPRVFAWEDYLDAYKKENDIDIRSPLSLKDLIAVRKRMDTDIATQAKEEPNMILIVTRNGGASRDLGEELSVRVRSWGKTPNEIIEGQGVFADTHIDVTSVVLFGGPNMILAGELRHVLQQAKDALERRAANVLSLMPPGMTLNRLMQLPKERFQGGSRRTVWELTGRLLSVTQLVVSEIRSGRAENHCIPDSVLDFISPPDELEGVNKFIPPSTRAFLGLNENLEIADQYAPGKDLSEQIKYISDILPEDSLYWKNPFLLMWRLFWNFAAAEVFLGESDKVTSKKRAAAYCNPE